MLTVQAFQFNDHDLLMHQDINGDFWFRGTNVCSILGYSNSAETLRTHVNDYIRELAIGVGKPALYVAEKGLYILAFRSKTPAALEFQLWAADVIKTIRKTGQYTATEQDQQHFTPFGIQINLVQESMNEALHMLRDNMSDPSAVRAYSGALDSLQRILEHTKEESTKEIASAAIDQSHQEYILEYIKRKGTYTTLNNIVKNRYARARGFNSEAVRNLLKPLLGVKLEFVQGKGYLAIE